MSSFLVLRPRAVLVLDRDHLVPRAGPLSALLPTPHLTPRPHPHNPCAKDWLYTGIPQAQQENGGGHCPLHYILRLGLLLKAKNEPVVLQV